MLTITSDVHLSKNTNALVDECVSIMLSVDPLFKKKHLLRVFKEIAHNYNPNYFHNFKHAFEVFQMTNYLLQYVNLSILNKKLLLVVSICHDINHLGLNNKYFNNELYDSKTVLPEPYSYVISKRSNSYDSLNDIESVTSINEEVHIMYTHYILYKYTKELFGNIDFDTIKYITNTITPLILCTDLSLHSKYLDVINNDNRDLSTMIHIIKIADLSHPLRPFNVHIYWVFNLINEEENVLLKRNLDEIAKDSIHFIKLFLEPLLLGFISKYIKSSQLHTCLLHTVENWEKYIRCN